MKPPPSLTRIIVKELFDQMEADMAKKVGVAKAGAGGGEEGPIVVTTSVAYAGNPGSPVKAAQPVVPAPVEPSAPPKVVD